MSAQSPRPRAEVERATILGVAGLCVALNVGLGAVAYLIKFPVYLDAVGTIVFALLAGAMGWRGFVLTAFIGSVSFVVTGLLLNPVVIWFIPTQVAIAAYCFWIARPALCPFLGAGALGRAGAVRVVLLGLGLGVVAGIVSAPTITYVFGGITGAGASVVVAVLLKSGATLYDSVLASGVASEPLDKTIQLAVAVSLVLATPRRVRALFG